MGRWGDGEMARWVVLVLEKVSGRSVETRGERRKERGGLGGNLGSRFQSGQSVEKLASRANFLELVGRKRNKREKEVGCDIQPNSSRPRNNVHDVETSCGLNKAVVDEESWSKFGVLWKEKIGRGNSKRNG
jgi:hypothetical protein